MKTTERLRPSRLIALIAPIALAAALAACGSGGGSPASPNPTSSAPTSSSPSTSAPSPVLSVSPPPWPLPADAAPYIAAAGLQALSHETLAVHYHAHLDIIASGRPVPVPAGIGFIVQNGQPVALTSLHTHDDSGVIHIESAVDKPFTLGQFFTQWGVKLDAHQMGGLVAGNGQDLRLYVNGVIQTTAPQSLVLRPHQEIVLWYGPSSGQPNVPSSYSFPSGD